MVCGYFISFSINLNGEVVSVSCAVCDPVAVWLWLSVVVWPGFWTAVWPCFQAAVWPCSQHARSICARGGRV